MKNVISFFILLILFGCTKQSDKNSDFEQKLRMVGKIEFNDEINSFVSDFMKSLKDSDCIYEIYVDKKTEEEYFLTLFNEPNKPDYLSNRFPVNYTRINGKYVFIYSGIEDFIKKEKYKPEVEFKEMNDKRNFEASTISKVILKDTSYIAGPIGLPFSEIKFSPLEIDDKIEK